MSRRSACLFGFAALFLFVVVALRRCRCRSLRRISAASGMPSTCRRRSRRIVACRGRPSGSKRWFRQRRRSSGWRRSSRSRPRHQHGRGRHGRVSGAVVVADARRRAHGDGGALRHLRIPAAASRHAGRAQHPRVAEALVHSDAESRRRRAVPAPERAGHRHQPRRPQAPDPGGPRSRPCGIVQPRVGFNLHNQSWRTSVGDPPKPASISLLSVAFDKARSGSEGRTLTKKICAVIRDALEPFASARSGATTTSSRCGRSATT